MPEWMNKLIDLLPLILIVFTIVFAMLSFCYVLNGEKVKSYNYSICTLLSLEALVIIMIVFIDGSNVGKIQWINVVLGFSAAGISYEIFKIFKARKQYVLQEKRAPRKKRRRGHLRLIQ